MPSLSTEPLTQRPEKSPQTTKGRSTWKTNQGPWKSITGKGCIIIVLIVSKSNNNNNSNNIDHETFKNVETPAASTKWLNSQRLETAISVLKCCTISFHCYTHLPFKKVKPELHKSKHTNITHVFWHTKCISHLECVASKPLHLSQSCQRAVPSQPKWNTEIFVICRYAR